MLPRLPHAVSLSLTLVLASASGACGASRPASGSPTPAPVLEPILPPVSEKAPVAESPEHSGPKVESPRDPPKAALAAGSPFFGTYEVTRIVKDGGGAETPGSLDSCGVSDCVLVRRSYAFEGTTLRMRYLLVSVAQKDGAASTTVVCDAQAAIDVTWEKDAMIVPATVVAKANADVIRRKQRPEGGSKFKVDWNTDHLGCSSTLRAGRYVVKEVSSEKRGTRPVRLSLASPQQTHELHAVDEDVDVEAAINAFFGQH